MKKRRIVIASVLKPVDDTRMLEKMGMSLRDAGYEVAILGYPSRAPVQEAGAIVLLPHAIFFRRVSLRRMLAPWGILVKTIRRRPHVFIVNTHELLLPAALYRIFFGARIVYDIRENYYLNIRHTRAFRRVLRVFLASWVRFKERILVPFVDHFILAEKAYLHELRFLPRIRTTILENKVSDVWRAPKAQRGRHRLLFTGTLAETTGVFDAIVLARALHELDSQIRLTIAGYCAMSRTFRRLCEMVNASPFVRLVGGDMMVPHKQIMQLVAESDFGLVLYPPNEATRSSVPTKVYEYMGNRLPIVMRAGGVYETMVLDARAGIVWNNAVPVAELLASMRQDTFYTGHMPDINWNEEATKLLALVRQLAF